MTPVIDKKTKIVKEGKTYKAKPTKDMKDLEIQMLKEIQEVYQHLNKHLHRMKHIETKLKKVLSRMGLRWK